MRQSLSIFCLVLLLLSSSPLGHAQEPSPPRYAARGPYVVGTRDFTIPADESALEATVWYPALNPEGLDDTVSYGESWYAIEGQAIRDAEPDVTPGPYPLVIFSHGSGGFRYQSVYFTEHLASYGFVVMAVDHPGNTTLDLLGSNATEGQTVQDMIEEHTGAGGWFDWFYDEENAARNMAISLATRPFDVLQQIAYAEEMTADGGLLAGMVDTERIAVTGHSFGGYTALAAGGARLDYDALDAWCRRPELVSFDPYGDPPFTTYPAPRRVAISSCFIRFQIDTVAQARGLDGVPYGPWPATTDPRIRAVVALAPWNAPVFGREGLAFLTVPTMIQVGSLDPVALPERDAYAVYTGIGSEEKALVILENKGHLAFANQFFKDTGISHEEASALHGLINHFATGYLLSLLYEDGEAAATLDPDAIDIPDIRYLTTMN